MKMKIGVGQSDPNTNSRAKSRVPQNMNTSIQKGPGSLNGSRAYSCFLEELLDRDDGKTAESLPGA